MTDDTAARRPGAWAGAGLTHIGLVRTQNQDAFAVRNDLGLWIVADGMGGHPGGDLASRLTVEAIVEQVAATPCPDHLEPAEEARRLVEAVRSAHQQVRERARAQPEFLGMGTTVVALSIPPAAPSTTIIAHVGDSRAYLLRQGRLIPLTRDHSLVEDYIDRGLLTPAAARVHPNSHVLTRAIGIDPDVRVDTSEVTLEPADLLLLCTDGLTKMLEDAQILRALEQGDRSPETVSRRLVDLANEYGGFDNTTIVVIARCLS